MSSAADAASHAPTDRSARVALRKGLTNRDISRVLGPRYLVEPSMRSAGGHLRIQVLLVDASNGEQLWAQHHDHERVDVLKVQDEIAAAVVGALAPALLQLEGYAWAAATCVGARRSETLRGSLRHRRIDSNYNQTPEELGTEAKCRLAA